MPKLTINSYGELIWENLTPAEAKTIEKQFPDLQIRFCYATKIRKTLPFNIAIVNTALAAATSFNITLDTAPKAASLLEKPRELVENFMARRYEMSYAERSDYTLKSKTKQPVSNFILAAVEYGVVAKRVLLADEQIADRRLAALLIAMETGAMPCIIVTERQTFEDWRTLIASIFHPNRVAIISYDKVSPTTPKDTFILAAYEDLENKNFRFLQDAPKIWGLIADSAEKLKNPQTYRTHNVEQLAHRTACRLLLTDFPIDLSPREILQLLKILGCEQAFGLLTNFLTDHTRDPLKNRQKFQWDDYPGLIDRVGFRLRCSCMVRRAPDPQVQIQERFQQVALGSIPKRVNPNTVHSALRKLGLQKVAGSIAVLKDLLGSTSGKTLILAHHNDVVEAIAAALKCPAIYGKVRDPQVRAALAAEFAAREGAAALIVADDVELQWQLGDVRQVVVVELLLTPREIDRIKNWLIQSEQPLLWYWFYARNPLDQQAIKRLRLRLADYNRMIDEITSE